MTSFISFLFYAIHLSVSKTFTSSFNFTEFVCKSSWKISKFAYQKSNNVYKCSSASIRIVKNSKAFAYKFKKIYDLSKTDFVVSKSSLK